MDVYRPRTAAAPAPVLILFNTLSGAERGHPFYRAWAEIAAAKGLVAILPDLRVATLEQDFDALLAHLAANGASFGADRDRIAVYAGSGNVFRGLPLFVDPRRTALKAMVLYYGSADVKTFRGDLPTLFVRAGLDRPPVNRAMTELITLAQTQNVPVSRRQLPGRPSRLRDVRRRTGDPRGDRHDARLRRPQHRARLPGVAAPRPAGSDRRRARRGWRVRGRVAMLRRSGQGAAGRSGCACPTGRRCSARRSSPPPAPSSSG